MAKAQRNFQTENGVERGDGRSQWENKESVLFYLFSFFFSEGEGVGGREGKGERES